MNQPAPWTLYYGQNQPPPETTPLRAGPLSMIYENGDLRYIFHGKHEIARRIYVAVRDFNWATIPAQIELHEMSIHSDSFLIRYRAVHQQGDIHFAWEGILSGSAEGHLTFSMDGTVLSTFRRNRIGFCVLHPMTCAGVPCTVEQVGGGLLESTFPVAISPHQPFQNMRAITHNVKPGLRAEIRLKGENFEMEDQRNWTDASYKIYGTPLELPFPVTVDAGTRLQQSVELRLLGTSASPVIEQNTDSSPIIIDTAQTSCGSLPRLGLSLPQDTFPITALETARLRQLNLAHLRVDLHFARLDWQARLLQAVELSGALGVALEVALHLSANPEQELASLRDSLEASKARIASWLVFREGHVVTPPGLAELARQHLAAVEPSALFAGGTDAFFVQLNRERPATDVLDLLTYSINPQVHAFDNASLVETLPAQAVPLSSARQFSASKPIIVSPVTFKLRYNPAFTGAPPETPPGQLPDQVDPRQMSLFGAGWTLGSIRYLAEGGAYSATYYETTGWLGVMERAGGSPLPEKFPSLPGSVFPLYHIFADVGALAGAEILQLSSSDPLKVDGLFFRQDNQSRLMLANFTANKQTLQINGLRGSFTVKMLDEQTAQEAITEPESYRARPGQSLVSEADQFSIELAPFAVATIDIQNT